jgi:hypothetical protein
MKYLLLTLFIAGCHAQGCPPATVQKAEAFKLEMLQGLKSKDDCKREIEESCR